MENYVNLALQKRLQGLADLMPAFQEREDQQKISPYLVSSALLVYQFRQAAYGYNWVQGVNYLKWMRS